MSDATIGTPGLHRFEQRRPEFLVARRQAEHIRVREHSRYVAVRHETGDPDAIAKTMASNRALQRAARRSVGDQQDAGAGRPQPSGSLDERVDALGGRQPADIDDPRVTNVGESVRHVGVGHGRRDPGRNHVDPLRCDAVRLQALGQALRERDHRVGSAADRALDRAAEPLEQQPARPRSGERVAQAAVHGHHERTSRPPCRSEGDRQDGEILTLVAVYEINVACQPQRGAASRNAV